MIRFFKWAYLLLHILYSNVQQLQTIEDCSKDWNILFRHLYYIEKDDIGIKCLLRYPITILVPCITRIGWLKGKTPKRLKRKWNVLYSIFAFKWLNRAKLFLSHPFNSVQMPWFECRTRLIIIIYRQWYRSETHNNNNNNIILWSMSNESGIVEKPFEIQLICALTKDQK